MYYITINGKIEDADKYSILTKNNAFKYGYGLFETMLILNNNIKLFDYHWERLLQGLDILHMIQANFQKSESSHNHWTLKL